MTGERLDRARRVLDVEAHALTAIRDRLDARFTRALDLLLACRGKVVVTGVGKSGIVCRKIAATLASTGTPAFFLHAGEGSHGDVGTLVRGDVLLAVSNSGESEEVLRLLPVARRFGIPLVAISGDPDSRRARSGSRPPPARRRPWRSATRSRSPCSRSAVSRPRTSLCSIRAALSGGG